jgi:parallel beta-helix repeat protein
MQKYIHLKENYRKVVFVKNVLSKEIVAGIIGLTILLLAGGAGAKTLTVDDSGGADFTNIQAAINDATAGDTILVYSGTYNENVIVSKSLILKGIDNGWGKPIIIPMGRDERGSLHNAITLRSGDCIIDGFKTIDGDSGIYVNSTSNIITNNTLLNGGGIRLVGSSNNIIKNNIAINNYYDIGMDFSDNNTIYNNFLSSNNNLGGLAKSLNKWNLTRTANINIIGGSYLGGNVWTNPSGTGFSQTCEDNNNDGICDSPYISDSPYYLGAGNLDQLPLVYKPLTTRLINFALIFLTIGTIVMIYLKRDSIWDEIRSTALTAIKGAIKNLIIGVIMGALAGFVVGGVIATILLHLGFFAKADDPAWIYGISMILGAFLGVIVGAIDGLIKDVTIGAIAGAICGIVFEISLANKDLTTIREFIGGAIGVVILGAIAGSLISRAIFNAREIGSMSGAIIGGIIGFGGLFQSMSGSFMGSIFTGIIFGCFIGGVLELLARRLTANKEAIPLGAILGLFGSVIAGSITGIFFHGEALYVSLIASMLVGAIIGGTICLYSGSGKYAFIRAFIGGMIAGSLAGLIGGGVFIDGILIINKKIFDESVMFSGIVGAVVGMVIGALQTRKNALLESAVAGSISAEIAGLFGYAAAGGSYPKISLLVILIVGAIVGGFICKYYGTRKNAILFVILGGIITGIILGVVGGLMRF